MTDPNSYQAIGWIAVALFAAAGGINQVLKITDRLKGKPPVEELNAMMSTVNNRLNVLDSMIDTLRTETNDNRDKHATDNDERRRAIYEKIEQVRRELKEDIKDVEGKIGNLPNELIVLLKNTGALRRSG